MIIVKIPDLSCVDMAKISSIMQCLRQLKLSNNLLPHINGKKSLEKENFCCGLPYLTSPNLVSVVAEMIWYGSTLCGHPDIPAIKFV
ncbi:hypothetical protein U3516DRAFT_746631 [Neocallimastix sp. 'constans']